MRCVPSKLRFLRLGWEGTIARHRLSPLGHDLTSTPTHRKQRDELLTRLRFVVSHSSTMKPWMNGALRVLGRFMTGPPAFSSIPIAPPRSPKARDRGHPHPQQNRIPHEIGATRRSGQQEPPDKEKSKNPTRKLPHATKVAYPPLRRPSRGFARCATRKKRAPLTAVLAAGKRQP